MEEQMYLPKKLRIINTGIPFLLLYATKDVLLNGGNSDIVYR